MKNSTDKNTEILIKVSEKIAEGYGEDFLKLTTKIDKQKEEETLPEGLKKIYDEVKNTPNDEPELFELTKEIQRQDKSIVDLVLRFMNEEELDEYSIDEIAFFAGMVTRKVTSKKDENGVFKQTKNTEKWQRPKPSAIKTFDKKVKSFNNETSDEEKIKLNNEFEEFLLKASKMDGVKLSEWEKELVIQQTSESIRGYLNSFLGKK